MAGGYVEDNSGTVWIVARLEDLEAAVAELRGANGLESATITGPNGLTAYDPTTGARMQYAGGRLRFWSDYDTSPSEYGEVVVDPSGGSVANYLRWFPPHSDGTGDENSITIQGRRTGQAGNGWWYGDGQITIRVQDDDGTKVGFLNLAANQISIDTNALPLYSLPTTSSGANLHLGTVGGQWTVAWVTSSERYKTDITDADIDPDAVLRWRPRTWRDKADVEAVGAEAAEHIGFIAEEIHATTPEFVVLDDEGRPDSLKYDRMTAGLVALVQRQQKQIDALTARLDTKEAK